MAKISIMEKLAQLISLSLVFSEMSHTKDQDGNAVILFQLDNPLPVVRGSQDVDIDGEIVPVLARDVTEIRVHESDLVPGFEWDTDTDTGSYKGSDLILDVSKANGQVWLRQETFRQSGRTFGNQRRTQRFAEMFKGANAGKNPGAQNAQTGAGARQAVDTNAS